MNNLVSEQNKYSCSNANLSYLQAFFFIAMVVAVMALDEPSADQNLGDARVKREADADPTILSSIIRGLSRRPSAFNKRPPHGQSDFINGEFNHHGHHGHGGKRSAEPSFSLANLFRRSRMSLAF